MKILLLSLLVFCSLNIYSQVIESGFKDYISKTYFLRSDYSTSSDIRLEYGNRETIAEFHRGFTFTSGEWWVTEEEMEQYAQSKLNELGFVPLFETEANPKDFIKAELRDKIEEDIIYITTNGEKAAHTHYGHKPIEQSSYLWQKVYYKASGDEFGFKDDLKGTRLKEFLSKHPKLIQIFEFNWKKNFNSKETRYIRKRFLISK